MAVLTKSDNDSQDANAQGPSKQPKVGLDIVTGVTDSHPIRQPLPFPFKTRHYHNDDTDDDGDTTPRSNEERLLNAKETIPQRIKATTSNTNLLRTHVPNFRVQMDKFVEFEHLLLRNLSSLAKDY